MSRLTRGLTAALLTLKICCVLFAGFLVTLLAVSAAPDVIVMSRKNLDNFAAALASHCFGEVVMAGRAHDSSRVLVNQKANPQVGQVNRPAVRLVNFLCHQTLWSRRPSATSAISPVPR